MSRRISFIIEGREHQDRNLTTAFQGELSPYLAARKAAGDHQIRATWPHWYLDNGRPILAHLDKWGSPRFRLRGNRVECDAFFGGAGLVGALV